MLKVSTARSTHFHRKLVARRQMKEWPKINTFVLTDVNIIVMGCQKKEKPKSANKVLSKFSLRHAGCKSNKFNWIKSKIQTLMRVHLKKTYLVRRCSADSFVSQPAKTRQLGKLTLSLHQNQSGIKRFVYDSTYVMYTTPNPTKALTQSPNSWDEPSKFYLKKVTPKSVFFCHHQ